jgi:RNA polymerase sigma-70 factor, ECF subfamily
MSSSDTAFNQLLTERRAELRQLALRYCRGDHAVADDLVQDTCERAWRKRESIIDISSLRPWLNKILHNCWLDKCIKKQLLVVPVDDVPEHPIQTEELLPWQRATADDLRHAIEQLAEPYRSVAISFYVDHMTIADIARQRATRYMTVATQLRRAREKLRELLRARLDEQEK